MALGVNQVTHLSQLLTTFTSTGMFLSTGHEPCFLPLLSHFLIPYHLFIHHNSAHQPGTMCESFCPAQSFMVLGRTLLSRIIITPNLPVPEAVDKILPSLSIENWGRATLVLWGPPGLKTSGTSRIKFFLSHECSCVCCLRSTRPRYTRKLTTIHLKKIYSNTS